MPIRTWSQTGALVLLGLICIELFLRLSQFPGLHGDEAWTGLRALQAGAGNSLHGMNFYSGSLFPRLVAGQFSLTGVSVFSLRLPGALCNAMAMALVTAILWRRGAAFLALLLFASSLLFLFYSRVAWEVSALQNLLMAVILAALDRTLAHDRPRPVWSVLFYAAFALGTWNHFIFLAAALSLALASTFLLLRQPNETTARLFVLAILNLPLLAILVAGLSLVPDGTVISRGVPALMAVLALAAAMSAIFVCCEPRLSHQLALPARHGTASRRIGNALAAASSAVLLFCLPLDGVSFFGTLSGYIPAARVAATLPSWPEAILLHGAAAILLVGLGLAAWRWMRRTSDAPILTHLLVLWTILFFPALRLETPHAPDRYYIVPQFLLFCALALSVNEPAFPWRRLVQAAAAFLFLYSQQFFWRAMEFAPARPPLDFHYGLYEDTSRNFITLAPLRTYLAGQGICEVRSSSFFIAQPLRFLEAAGPRCRGATARVEYCDTCRAPVPWFAVTPVPTGKASAN